MTTRNGESHHRTPLQRLIDKEDFAAILDCMTPNQLLYAGLRLVNLTDPEIARLMGLSDRSAISQTLANARRRIVRLRPDLEHHVTGRKALRRPHLSRKRPLDWSWISDDQNDPSWPVAQGEPFHE
jgi:hypothetical protein